MTITTGELLAQLLIAVLPTAVGEALNDLPSDSTIEDWKQAVKLNEVGEDETKLDLLLTYFKTEALFLALLEPVYDEQGNPESLGRVLKNRLWSVGAADGVLKDGRKWTTPPHPSAQDAQKLYELLEKFEESQTRL